MNRNLIAATIVVAVLGIVAGVAWLRSLREAGTDEVGLMDTMLAPRGPAGPTAVADSAPGPAIGPQGKKLPRVVDLGADKCKACKALAPILAELKKEYEGRVIVEFIDVWKNPRAGDPYKIRVIPTQIFYDADGNEVWRHEGFLPKADFVAKFAELGVK